MESQQFVHNSCFYLRFYRETRDNDYVAPYGLEYTEKEVVDGCVKYHFEELSDVEVVYL